MSRHYKIVSITFLCIILFIFPVYTFSQTSRPDSLNIKQNSDTSVSKHALFTSLGYGSNFIYMGSTISGNQPYGYTSLTYGLNSELFASVSTVHLQDISPFLAFHTGSLNYIHVFNSWFDISTGISRYQVASSLENTLFNSFTYADLTLGFDWKILYTKISGGILMADENNGYLQLSNSRYFETREYTRKKISFSFDPYFTILSGSITKIETTEGKVVAVSPPYKKGGKFGQSKPVTTISRSFSLMEADFGLPVSLNAGKFILEAEPGYIIPLSDYSENGRPEGFYFMLNTYFKIF